MGPPQEVQEWVDLKLSSIQPRDHSPTLANLVAKEIIDLEINNSFTSNKGDDVINIV